MPRDTTTEPLFPISDIQGDILVGLLKNHEHLIFFEIKDVTKFKAFLKDLDITSMKECLDQKALIDANKAKGIERVIPAPGLNIAFTYQGLKTLNVAGLPDPAALKTFHDGMAGSQAKLNDPLAKDWKILKPGITLHGVFLLTGATHAEVVDTISQRLVPAAANGWSPVHEEFGKVRPNPYRGHEHFGYADGVSQPGVRGFISLTDPLTAQQGTSEDQGQPGQDLLWPGQFVFGYKRQNPNAKKFTRKPLDKDVPAPFMENGSYLVFRKLAQKVPEFNASVKQAAAAIQPKGGETKPSAALLGAQMVGRWKSGAPLELTPLQDDLSIADGTANVNNFEFGDDRQGVRCPWAAHVRKVYPRNDVPNNIDPLDDKVDEQESDTQTRRIMRRGIAFGPEVTKEEAMSGKSGEPPSDQSKCRDNTRGLLFKCYVTSLENQFEFVQRSWANNSDFSQPGSGVDPIIGQTPAGTLRPFLGGASDENHAANKPKIPNLGLFVELHGGGYFFAPSIPALKSF